MMSFKTIGRVLNPWGAAGIALAAVTGGLPAAVLGSVLSAYAERREKEKPDPNADYAEQKAYVEKLLKELKAQAERQQKTDLYFDCVLAAYAIGLACASKNGIVEDSIRREIEEFTLGASAKVLPAEKRKTLDALAANPPSIATAIEVTKSYDKDQWLFFDDIVDLTLCISGHEEKRETQIRRAFNDAKPK